MFPITFSDLTSWSFKSVCAHAWPYLKQLVRLVIQTGCSPHQAHNQSYVSDVACLQQVENIVMLILGLPFLPFLLFLLFLQDRKPHVVSSCPFCFSLQLCSKETYHKTEALKDHFRNLDFVHPRSLSQYGLRLCDSSLRQEPPRRLWDNPAS